MSPEGRDVQVTCPACGRDNHRSMLAVKSRESFSCGTCGKLVQMDQETLISTIEAAIERMRRQLRGQSH